MRCWGVVLREFQSTALVSVSTAISFALSPPHGERRPFWSDLVGTRYSTHEKRTSMRGICRVHGRLSGTDPFEIRGFGPIFPPSLAQQAEALITPDHVSRFPTKRTSLPPSYASCCIYLLTFSADLSSVGEEDESTAFARWVIYPRCVYIYIACIYIRAYPRTKQKKILWIPPAKWILFNLLSQFNSIIDFTRLSEVNSTSTACSVEICIHELLIVFKGQNNFTVDSLLSRALTTAASQQSYATRIDNEGWARMKHHRVLIWFRAHYVVCRIYIYVYMFRTDRSTLYVGKRTNYSRAPRISICHLLVNGLIYVTESGCRFRAFRSIRWLIDGATRIDNTLASDFDRNIPKCEISYGRFGITCLFPLSFSHAAFTTTDCVSSLPPTRFNLLLSRYLDVRRYTSRNACHYKGPGYLDIDLQFRRQLRKARNMLVQIRSD